MDREDLVAEQCIGHLTDSGQLHPPPAGRVLPPAEQRWKGAQGRGDQGGGCTSKQSSPASPRTGLLIFTDMGRVYGFRAWETPLASRYGRGTHIRNLLTKIRDDEAVISILPMARELIEKPEGNYLIFATKNGRIKRSRLSEYVKINRNGKVRTQIRDRGRHPRPSQAGHGRRPRRPRLGRRICLQIPPLPCQNADPP